MTPERIQRRRTKGWRKPEGAVVVSRPSKWGNPFRIGEPSLWANHAPMDRQQAVEAYRYMIASVDHIVGERAWSPNPYFAAEVRGELRGRDLACWCPLDQPCHADVLLEIANAPVAAAVWGDPE
jgi:uncharacterized protein DUF4326